MRIKKAFLLVVLSLAVLLASCDSTPSCTLTALAGGSDVACESDAD